MGASALLTGLGIRFLGPGTGLSLGALTSLTLTGPLLDVCVQRARTGWRLYLAFAMAGLGANLVAFFVRGGAKLLSFEHVGARPLSNWILHASYSYALCGILAGLISAAIWFQATQSKESDPGE